MALTLYGHWQWVWLPPCSFCLQWIYASQKDTKLFIWSPFSFYLDSTIPNQWHCVKYSKSGLQKCWCQTRMLRRHYSSCCSSVLHVESDHIWLSPTNCSGISVVQCGKRSNKDGRIRWTREATRNRWSSNYFQKLKTESRESQTPVKGRGRKEDRKILARKTKKNSATSSCMIALWVWQRDMPFFLFAKLFRAKHFPFEVLCITSLT